MSKAALILVLSFFRLPFQEVTVVSYSNGKANTAGYENFSFWTKDGQRAYIQYTYGKDAKDVMVKYLGPDSLNGQHGFLVQVPGKPLFYVIPEGYKLKITDKAGKYMKRFTWEKDEPGATGEPADTTSAPCEICVKNEQQAMQLIVKRYMH